MLVVLDEPNANLDEAGDAALMKAVVGLKAAGKTVFLISHRPGVLAAADRVLFLRDGYQIAFDAPAAVLEQLKAAARPATPPANALPA